MVYKIIITPPFSFSQMAQECQKVNHVRIFLKCPKPGYVPWDPRARISKLMTYTERMVSSVRSKIISMT